MEKKSIVKNYIYNLTYQVFILIIPLITIPYLSRVLGPENIGIYGYTLSIATYFLLFGSLGVSMYAQREFAYVQDDPDKRSKLFFEIIILRCITMLFSSIVYYFSFANQGDYSFYYKLLLLEFLSTVLDITSFYQGLEEFKKVIFRNLIIRGLGCVLIFVLVKTQDDLVTYMLIYSLCNILGNVSLWFYLPKYLKKVKLKELKIFKHLKPTLVLFIPQIAIQIYTVLDKTMLGYLSADMNQVGYYEQAQKIVKVFLTIVTAIGIVMFPRISNEFANKNNEKIIEYIKKSFKFVYLLAFPIVFGLIAVAEDFVPLFLGENFLPSIQLVQFSAMIVLFIGMSNILGVQYMIPLKKEKQYTITYIIAACINVIINFLLIPKFAAIGAVIGTIVAEFSVVVVQLYFLRNEISIKMVISSMTKYFIMSIIMFVPIYLMRDICINPMMNIIIQIAFGSIIYFVGLYLLKDDLLLEGKDKLMSKLKINKTKFL